ncbi:MAG TPA: molybdopterin biosynthesis protein [Desulfobacteraceae bacterium]|nr:molybdopterin biosynthesis protein [Desulfobacteraceae bacterium]
MKRKIYLKMEPLEVARDIFQKKFSGYRTGEEEINSREADGRITSRPVSARLSAPSFHAAAMDGLAVEAANTFGASDETPVTLQAANGQAIPVNTGQPLPEGKDAVIMIENVLFRNRDREVIIRAPVYPWQNVRKVGEDIVATEQLYPTNHLLGPADIGALLTAGCPTVWVRRKPRVMIIPTGNELIDGSEADIVPPPGKTIESNSGMLAALAARAGAIPSVSPIIRDDYDTIKQHLLAAVDSAADMIMINAGSSAGSADYTSRIIEELGEVLVHGVTIMPGKPTILGVIGGKPVIGNPGYPVSSLISCEQFVQALLAHMQGLRLPERKMITAVLGKNMPSRGGLEEFRRMITGRIGSRFVTMPLKKGAGAITTITRANTILRIPASSEGENKDAVVALELLRPLDQVERTILCTGSHDLTLDLIHDFLKRSDPAYPLASTHVGSLGGIMAVKSGMTHVAGSHLLDPATGEYNTGSIRQYLTGLDVTLITLVHRQQGFMVRSGNPKSIRGVEDLLRGDVTYVNRQGGSGTRVLLDYELDRAGLSGTGIRGYDFEEYTHMSVAVAVLSGKADAGLGIMAAARALQLDFIPVTEERYDLIIPTEIMTTPGIMQLLNIINSDPFKKKVEKMGGYSTRETGNVVRL